MMTTSREPSVRTCTCWLIRSSSDPCEIIGPFECESELEFYIENYHGGKLDPNLQCSAEEWSQRAYLFERDLFLSYLIICHGPTQSAAFRHAEAAS